MTTNRRSRRGGRKHRICQREGCRTKVPEGSQYPTCCTLCGLVCVELEKAENLCRATGDTELWAAVVALNDALTEHRAQFGRVFKAAREVGITEEQWRSIRGGEGPRPPRGFTPAPATLTGTLCGREVTAGFHNPNFQKTPCSGVILPRWKGGRSAP